MFTASSSVSEPGSVKGIVVRMRLKRSLAARSRHAFAKFTPVRGGASLLPFMSGKWQVAHLTWYVARPAVACSTVEGPALAGCWAGVESCVHANAMQNTPNAPQAAKNPFLFRPSIVRHSYRRGQPHKLP